MLLTSLCCCQLFFLGAVNLDASRTGFVLASTTFPTVLPGDSEHLPTLAAYDTMLKTLDRVGLNTPKERSRHVSGALALPFWANGWSDIAEVARFDPLQTISSPFLTSQAYSKDPTAATSDLKSYRLDHCDHDKVAVQVRPDLCLFQTRRPPALLTTFRFPDGTTMHAEFNRLVDQYGSELNQQALANKLNLSIDTNRLARIAVRGLRPSRLISDWTPPMWTLTPDLDIVDQINSYAVQQLTYRVPDDVTEVTLHTRSLWLDITGTAR